MDESGMDDGPVMDGSLRERLESVLGHEFGDDGSLLTQALTHASRTDTRLESNERQEFLGDAVLGLIACDLIYRRYPTLLEGEMTKIKSTVVSRRTCAQIACDLGLDEVIALGKGMQGNGPLPPSLAAAVFESIIAAIFVDGGYDAASRFLEPLLDPMVEQAFRSGHQQNFKSLLQQFAQQKHDATPNYRILDEKGPDHAKCFKVAVEIAGTLHESAWGSSKKESEQLAALNALRTLGVLTEDDTGELVVASEDEA